MRRTSLCGVLAATVLALAAPAAAPAAFQGESPCGARGFQCAKVVVPLDRSGAVPGQVSLDVRRLPAAEPARVGLVVLLGGPGQVASSAAGGLADDLGPIRGARDLIVADPRGVGRSDPLRCRSARASRCAVELGRRRGLYTAAADVGDLESIRQAGGYDQLALYATSYGTKVALQYAAAHPDRVDRMALDSIVAPEGPDPLQRSTFTAMRRVLPALCAGGACRGVTTSPERDLARLVRRLASRPLRARVFTGTGRPRTARITRVALLNVLFSGDLDPVIRAETPGAVRAALRSDGAPLARLAVRAGATRTVAGAALQAEGDVNRVRYVATFCEELPFPWSRTAGPATRLRQAVSTVRRLPASAFAPFDRPTALAGSILPLCLRWPVASPPPPTSIPLPPGIPSLLLSGEQDLRTPLEDARAVARRLGPTAQLISVANVGHSVLGADPSGCAAAAMQAFLAGDQAQPCGPVRPLVRPPRVPPRSATSLRPYRGVPGPPGRTLTATSRTVADAQRAGASALLEGASPRVGGLRGGTAMIEAAGLRLRRYSFVPGVELSGLLPSASGVPIRMRVGGRAAAAGRFTVAEGRVVGRLGGKRIDVPTHPPAP